MKNVIFAAIAVIALAACGPGETGGEHKRPHLVSIEYSTFNGNPVMLVDDIYGRIHLCIVEPPQPLSVISDENRDYLAREVQKIVAIGDQTIDQHRLRYVGGDPVWAPYGKSTPEYWSSCMYFGQRLVFDKDVILYGQNEPEGYDGYAELR